MRSGEPYNRRLQLAAGTVGECGHDGSATAEALSVMRIKHAVSGARHLFAALLHAPRGYTVGIRASRLLSFLDTLFVLCTTALALAIAACNPDTTGPVNGDPRPVTYFHPSWGPDDRIVFDHVPFDSMGGLDYENLGLYELKADGTEFRPLVLRRDLPGGITGGLVAPRWSPDGKWLTLGSLSDKQVYKLSASSLEIIQLTNESVEFAFPNWSPDGRMLCFSGPSGGRLAEAGIFVVKAEGGSVRVLTQADGIAPSWSSAGNEIAFLPRVDRKGYTKVAILDTVSASCRVVLDWENRMQDPQFSPDGQRILFHVPLNNGVDGSIWSISRAGTELKLLTAGGVDPSWSPDGTKIVYVKHVVFGQDRAGNRQLWIMNADGTAKRQLSW